MSDLDKNPADGGDVVEQAGVEAEAGTAIKSKREGVGGVGGGGQAASKPRKRHRGLIVLAVVLAVLVVGGVGVFQWHKQPSFCSTVCHIESTYVDNYEQARGVEGTDKYGNRVSNTDAMMAVLHSDTQTTAKPHVTCIDCHMQQENLNTVRELGHDGVAYMTGDYYEPRSERTGAELESWYGKESSQMCANENCHAYLLGEDGLVDRDKLEAVTAKMDFNPHSQHHAGQQMQCTTCHKGHRASVQACTACHEHEDVQVPDGWVTWQESQELMDEAF